MHGQCGSGLRHTGVSANEWPNSHRAGSLDAHPAACLDVVPVPRKIGH
jgi:hypothetical protein